MKDLFTLPNNLLSFGQTQPRWHKPILPKAVMSRQGQLFCSTGLPLARTRLIRSTFSSHCPLFSNPRHWLTSATLIIISSVLCSPPGQPDFIFENFYFRTLSRITRQSSWPRLTLTSTRTGPSGTSARRITRSPDSSTPSSSSSPSPAKKVGSLGGHF